MKKGLGAVLKKSHVKVWSQNRSGDVSHDSKEKRFSCGNVYFILDCKEDLASEIYHIISYIPLLSVQYLLACKRQY